MFMSLAFVLWVGIYDSIILPLASWIMKKPVCLSAKPRMGIGIFVSIFHPASSNNGNHRIFSEEYGYK